MVASNMNFRIDNEHLLAELTSAAYEVALRHGIGGSTPDAVPSIEVRDSLAQEPSRHVSMVMTNPP